ncbi:SseB family protein [Gemmiger sp.]
MKIQEKENQYFNQALETAVLALQQAPTQEQLAHTLTVVRRALQAGGQWIAAVEAAPGHAAELRPKTVQTADGGCWWYAFTSFEEQMKSPDAVKSTFWADIDSLLNAALAAPDVRGIILNPWHCTLQLDKTLIRIIKPQN